MTLGERIRSLRETANLSQAKIEKRTGIKREYLSRIENEGLKNLTLKTLQSLGKGLKVDPAILITDDLEILAVAFNSFEGKSFFNRFRNLSPDHQQQVLNLITFLEHQERNRTCEKKV